MDPRYAGRAGADDTIAPARTWTRHGALVTPKACHAADDMTTTAPSGASLATDRRLSVAGSGVTITSRTPRISPAAARAQHCLHSRQSDVRNSRSTSPREGSTEIASSSGVTPEIRGADPLSRGGFGGCIHARIDPTGPLVQVCGA